MGEPRWTNDRGISDLSIAIDEIYFLRSVLADESMILKAHLDYKTFPKSRREIAERQVERMRRFASGEMWAAQRDQFRQGMALRMCDLPESLTNHAWAEQRGLLPTSTEPSAEGAME